MQNNTNLNYKIAINNDRKNNTPLTEQILQNQLILYNMNEEKTIYTTLSEWGKDILKANITNEPVSILDLLKLHKKNYDS